MRQYEAMFVFESAFASEYANVEKEIERIMERADAEIILSHKWEDRKLAYEIKGHKRGCYVLVYFRVAPDRIAGIERDCRLCEPLLRVLILSAEHLSREKMDQIATNLPVGAQTSRRSGRGFDESWHRPHKTAPVSHSPSAAPIEDGSVGEAVEEPTADDNGEVNMVSKTN